MAHPIHRNLFLLTFGVVLCQAAAIGQSGFVRTYQLPTGTVIEGADATPDGGLILCGTIVDRAILMRLDVAGNVLWSRTYDTFGSGAGGGNIVFQWPRIGFLDVTAVNDSNYVVAGSGYGDSLVGDQMIMGRFSGQGDPGWASSWTNNWGGYNSAIDLESPDTVLVGGSFYSNTSVNFTLHRVAANTGASTLAPVLIDLGASWKVALDHGDDGNILLAGFCTWNGHCIIAKYDPSLNVLWKHCWTGFEPCAVKGLSNGSVVAAGDRTLLRLNSSGTVDWAKEIMVGTGEITDMLVRPDGKILVLGWTPGQIAYSWLALFDGSGNLQWIQQYGDIGDDYRLTELDLLADGSLRMSGMNGINAMVVATDSLGSSLSCSYPAPVYSVNPTTLVQQSDPFSDPGNPTNWSDLAPFGPVEYIPTSYSCANALPYTASGKVFNDLDLNGVLDPGEPGLPYIPVSVTPNNGYLFSNAPADHVFHTGVLGSYTLAAPLPAPWWQFTVGGSGYPITFTPTDTVFEDLDFGLAPLIDTTLLEGTLVRGTSTCLAPMDFTVTVANKGTSTPQGVVSVTLDPRYPFVSASPMPDSVVADTYYWAFDSLEWYQNTQRIISVLRPSTIYIWDTLQNVVNVWADDGFGTLTLADSLIWREVHTCSFDPNDKQVDPQGDGPLHATPYDIDWLTYTVRFQNTGNDTAYTVVIEDLLSNYLNYGSLQVMAHSHDLTGLSIGSGGLATFRFDDILLPDSNVNHLGSQGFITYRIRPNSGVTHLAEVDNNAAIYFDLNAPVITNTVQNVMVNCAESDIQSNAMDQGNGYLLAYTFSMDTLTYQYQWYLNGVSIPGANENFHFAMVSGQYSVELTDVYGCSAISSEVPMIITGTEEPDQLSIAVFPNPFDRIAQLFFSSPLTRTDQIRLVDLHGRALLTQQGNGTDRMELDREQLASGMYVLQVMHADGRSSSVRLVVE